MPTTGLSFYEIQVSEASQSIAYAFDALSADDISVIFIASDDNQTVLTLSTDYTLDFDNKTVTCTEASWETLTSVDITGSIRIYRTTSILSLLDFKVGAVLSEGDLDTAYKQGLFAAQEMTEDAAKTNAGIQSVTSNVIEDGAVTEDKIAAGAVTAFKLANLSVDGSKIRANAVVEGTIQNNAVTNTKIANNSITTAKIFNDQVTTAKIADEAVTQDKVDKATKAEMEAQSSTDGVVTPDVLKFSPFAPRAYGSLSLASGDASFANSYNVASVTESGEERTVNFSVDLGLTNDYVVMATVTGIAGGYNAPSIVSKSSGSFTIAFNTSVGSGRGIDFVVFGSNLSS